MQLKYKMETCVQHSVFVSYSIVSEFLERKFVFDVVRQLKRRGLYNVLWIDNDECNMTSPSWYSERIKSAENLPAAIVFISDSYFSDNKANIAPLESKILSRQHKAAVDCSAIYLVIYSLPDGHTLTTLGSMFHTREVLDMRGRQTEENATVSIACDILHSKLVALPFVRISTELSPAPVVLRQTAYRRRYHSSKMCSWSAADVLHWLMHIHVPSEYCKKFSEQNINGQLLAIASCKDLERCVGIDNRAVRLKITQKILELLTSEMLSRDSWHLRLRNHPSQADRVYIIHDASDVALARNVQQDLARKSLHVNFNSKCSKSQNSVLLDQQLMHIGPQIATASHVVVLLTVAASRSQSVVEEILLSAWLGKKMITAMFNNVWTELSCAVKCTLGDEAAIDFESHLYDDSVDTLAHHLRCSTMAGIVLEQSYARKVDEQLQPLESLAERPFVAGSAHSLRLMRQQQPVVFISYQLDSRSSAERIERCLERHGFTCSLDSGFAVCSRQSALLGGAERLLRRRPATSWGGARTISRPPSAAVASAGRQSTQSDAVGVRDATVVVACVTAKYLQSSACVHDLLLADTLDRPVVAVTPVHSPVWPPHACPPPVRRLLARLRVVDLSNPRTSDRDLGRLVATIHCALDAAYSRI